MVLKVNLTPHAGRSQRFQVFRTPTVVNNNIIWCHSSMGYARAIVRYDSKSTRTSTIRTLPCWGSDRRSIRCGTATKFYKSIWKKEVRHLEKSAESTNEIESSSSTLTLAIRTPLAGKRYPSLNRDSQKDIKATCGQLK